jgi:hypothetical protein
MASNCKLVIDKKDIDIFEKELKFINPKLSIKVSYKEDLTLIEIDFADDKEYTSFLENLIKKGLRSATKTIW